MAKAMTWVWLIVALIVAITEGPDLYIIGAIIMSAIAEVEAKVDRLK